MSKSTHGKYSLTVPFEIMKVIDDLADVTGSNRSAVVSELLGQALPTIKTMIHSLREIQELTERQRAEVKEHFDNAERRAVEMQQETGAMAKATLRLLHKTKFGKH